MEAGNQLQASCPEQMPQTPLDRFDAVGKRLNAMENAIKMVRPALASFYDSLNDDRKLGLTHWARHALLRPAKASCWRV